MFAGCVVPSGLVLTNFALAVDKAGGPAAGPWRVQLLHALRLQQTTQTDLYTTSARVLEAIKSWGRGANGAAKLGGGQIGAKCWIFQTELGPIPVTRCDQCYAFSHQVGL